MNAIIINTKEVLESNLLGLGVEWDPSDIFDYAPEQWQLFVDRIAYMKPSVVRCMSSASAYCTKVNGGEFAYDWDSRMMKRLYRLLDVCEKYGVKVVIGEWWCPGSSLRGPGSDAVEMDDPRWGVMITDFLEELINNRRYTCIRYYNCVNEPNSRYADPFDGVWGAAIKNLRAEMDARGFADIAIMGPDPYANWDSWIDYSVGNVDNCLGEYEVHWYATRDLIRHGLVEKRMRALREKIGRAAPGKRFFFGEMGCLTGRNLPGDQQMELPMYWYGVAMADMLAQSFNAGMAGAIAWSFEDSMHLQKSNGGKDFLPCGDDHKDYSIKVWGFWNAVVKAFIDPQGGHGAEPEKTGYWLGLNPWEDMTALRPWYSAWAPLTRAFREGAATVKTNVPEECGLRCAAAIMESGRAPGKHEISFFIVNHTDNEKTARLQIADAATECDLAVYEYFSADSLAKDADGFPAASRIEKGVNLSDGFTVKMPAMSVILYTTLDGGSPLRLN